MPNGDPMVVGATNDEAWGDPAADPTVPHHYWSMSSHAESSGHVWYAKFQDGNVSNKDKEKPTISYVRAVRAGTCD